MVKLFLTIILSTFLLALAMLALSMGSILTKGKKKLRGCGSSLKAHRDESCGKSVSCPICGKPSQSNKKS